jgi:uncharacterized membrane protein
MRSRWLGFAVAALTIAVSAWAYPGLPDTVATHWNLRGEPDGFSSRLVAAALGPLLVLGLRLLSEVLPRIDPKRPRSESFFDTYWLLINGLLLFLGALHLAVIGTGLGWAIDIGRLVPIGVGLLFILVGNYLGRVEPNWFLGIRTPWTLSSDAVWRRVHRTGAWLFVGGGVLFIVTAFVPRLAVVPLLVGIVAVVAVVPVVQSYVLWRKLPR